MVSDVLLIMIVVVDGSDGVVEGCVDNKIIIVVMFLLAMVLVIMG